MTQRAALQAVVLSWGASHAMSSATSHRLWAFLSPPSVSSVKSLSRLAHPRPLKPVSQAEVSIAVNEITVLPW